MSSAFAAVAVDEVVLPRVGELFVRGHGLVIRPLYGRDVVAVYIWEEFVRVPSPLRMEYAQKDLVELRDKFALPYTVPFES